MPFDSKDTTIKSGYIPFIQWNKQGATYPVETKNSAELFNFENQNNNGLVLEYNNQKQEEPTKQPETNTLQERIAKIEQELKKAENSSGLLGKAWSWFKNKTDKFLPVDSSNKVRKQLEIEKQKIKDIQKPEVFKELTGVKYSEENYENLLNGKIKLLSEQKLEGYKEGQDMVVDAMAVIGAGIVAGTALAAAHATGGAAAGALISDGIKGIRKGFGKLTGKEKAKIDTNNSIIKMLKYYGTTNDTKNSVSINITEKMKKSIEEKYGKQFSYFVEKRLKNPLSQKDLDNISLMMTEASKVTDISGINIHDIVLVYNTIKNGNRKFFSSKNIAKMSPQNWAIIMNCAKQSVTKEQLWALMFYKGNSYWINSALSSMKRGIPSGKIKPDTLSAVTYMKELVDRQVIPTRTKVIRTEGYGIGGNLYGFLSSVKINGTTLDKAMKEAVKKGDIAVRELENQINHSPVKFVAQNERFTSSSAIYPIKSDGKSIDWNAIKTLRGKVLWEFDIEPETKGIFIDGFNFQGNGGSEAEIVLQAGSYFELNNVHWDKNIKNWIIKARVFNTKTTKGAEFGALTDNVSEHGKNILNHSSATKFVKNLPYKIKKISDDVANKLCYKPSLNKLRKCATSIEKFEDYEKLFIKYHPSRPIIFNKNLNIEEIKKILVEQNLVIEYDYIMFENMKFAFENIKELTGRNIKAYLGHGGFSYAFLLDNNTVLKITDNNILDKNVLSRNLRKAFDSNLEASTNQIGTVRDRTYSIQEFGIPTTNKIAFRHLTNVLKSKGAKFDIDWDTRQCARFRDTRKTFWGKINPFGVLKVVDLGCVHPPEAL